MTNTDRKALLLEVIGEDAVIEGIEFDFEQGTFTNVFGGKTITVNEACRLMDKADRFGNCVVVHCTDDEIIKNTDENVLAEIVSGKGEKLPEIHGKALLLKQVAGSVSGFELFSDNEINELIDLCDVIVREFAAEQEK
ncbi:MAG: hypothetical protein ACI4KF_04945 [Huintestinicola sp.]